MKKLHVIAVFIALAMLGAAVAGESLKPRIKISEQKPEINLETLVPLSFGEWSEQKHMRPVLPDPTVQAILDQTYSQTLARTYVNAKGQHIMLTIAYGTDQNSEATAAHRPEFCYTGAGFRIENIGQGKINFEKSAIDVNQLVGRLGNRVEPISYWVTLDETATLPGLSRKLSQIRYGLKGEIADGMLVRVSSINANVNEAFALHDEFIKNLRQNIPAEFRSRFFGAVH